jgi:nucleoside-diphosphate-sugar epimerase
VGARSAAIHPAGQRLFLKPGAGLADESEGMAIDASPLVAEHARIYTELESRVLNAEGIEGVALRYGFFYGPGTWYIPDGAAADQARKQELAIIGAGEGVWSWVHIEDAAIATVAALTAPPGVYHVVDDDPSPVSRWLPAFARWVGVAPQDRLTVQERSNSAARTPSTTAPGSARRQMRKQKDCWPSRPVGCNGWKDERVAAGLLCPRRTQFCFLSLGMSDRIG